MKCSWPGCDRDAAGLFCGEDYCIPHIDAALQQSHRDVLLSLLNKMDVPEDRKSDLHWLRRNLSIRNSEHPDFPEANRLIHHLLKEMHRQSKR